ncbi:MAG: prenyltransferase [Deltaproteobacteria bacterium]|nr:prenyltransferase [Deltaproteobacteria bacterium]
MRKTVNITTTISGWIKLSRPPFHTVGMFPFILGALLAWRLENTFDATVFILGISAVILTMLSTYHSGEYSDYQEDIISQKIHKNRFAGGSGVFPSEIIPRRAALWTSLVSITIAGIIGLVLQFGLKTGQYTILLGAAGLFFGFFYSTKPVRLVSSGLGELTIGLCYGWLPVAVAFYIQTGYINPIIHWIALPIGMTIFNVILLNEFPDYPADKKAGKKNMLVRLGIKRGVAIYSAVSILAWIAMFLSLKAGVPFKALYLYIPVMVLSAVIVVAVLNGKYKKHSSLEVLCGLNIAVNLGTTGSYILAFI